MHPDLEVSKNQNAWWKAKVPGMDGISIILKCSGMATVNDAKMFSQQSDESDIPPAI